MHGGVALWQEEKKEFYKLRLVLQSKNYLMECGTQKKELPYGMWDTKKGISLWYVKHKKGIAYGGELYKVGEKIVV